MGDGFTALDAIIRRVRSMGELASVAAPEVARELKASLDEQIAAGRAPDGTAWAPRKEDGGRALQNAAKAVKVRAEGRSILVILSGPEVFHHFGAGAAPVRQIIPSGAVPLKLGEAIRRGLVTGYRRIAKGGK
jgi:Phage virion morphogenesis family